MSRKPESCLLCGSETERTAVTLVEWKEPVAGETWSNVPRCVDRMACRSRVEAVLREPWPINDRTPAPPRSLAEIAAELVEPAADPPSPAVEEASPWAR